MKISISAVLVILSTVSLDSFAEEFSCGQLIVLYAFTSTAQLQCGFSAYSQSWKDKAQGCLSQLREAKYDEGLKKGIEMFNDEVVKQGKAAACKDIANAFPDAIIK
jgi:hypothetical protein